MRRIPKKRIAWLRRRNIKLNIRRRKNKSSKRRRRKSQSIIYLKPPEIFDLSRNYGKVAKFINTLRSHVSTYSIRRRLVVDFEPIKEVSPDAALILSAELDRWRFLYNTKLRPWRIQKWDLEVKRLFLEMGLFDLLKIPDKVEISNHPGELKFFKFFTANSAAGSIAGKLMDCMTDELSWECDEPAFFMALSEALTNVSQHAYPENHEYRHPIARGQWWLAGSYNRQSGEITIMCYDQGIGIPATLPLQGIYENCLGILDTMGLYYKLDADLILAALEYGRTRTNLDERGKGLQDILSFAKDGSGTLRIISRQGECICHANGEYNRKHRKYPLDGTFIQWSFRHFSGDNT